MTDKLRDLYRERNGLRSQIDVIYDIEDDLMSKRHALSKELNDVKDKIMEEQKVQDRALAKLCDLYRARETIETTN